MTTRFKVLCGAILIIALLFVGVSFTSNLVSALPFTKVQLVTPNPAATDSGTYPPGAAAIPIHTSGVSANTTTNASTPAFTKDDVIAFVNKHGFAGGPVAKGAHLKILMIQFVTAAQASQLMKGESVGRPDDYLVCYVRVEGPFQVKDAEVPPGAKLPAADIGDMVFDAHTGNLLVWGVY